MPAIHMLKIERDIDQQALTSILSNLDNIHLLEVVYRVSDT